MLKHYCLNPRNRSEKVQKKIFLFGAGYRPEVHKTCLWDPKNTPKAILSVFRAILGQKLILKKKVAKNHQKNTKKSQKSDFLKLTTSF